MKLYPHSTKVQPNYVTQKKNCIQEKQLGEKGKEYHSHSKDQQMRE